MKEVVETLSNMKFGKIQSFAKLTLVPLLSKDTNNENYEFLDDSLSTGKAIICELDSSGSVPKIRLKNNGETPILMIDGEELVGCKQNRILNLSILAAGNKEIEIFLIIESEINLIVVSEKIIINNPIKKSFFWK